jgi:hypothetical protein
MRLDEFELLIAVGRAGAEHAKQTLASTFDALNTSGATRHLVTIDLCNTRLATTIIGIISLFESRLQSRYGWKEPWKELVTLLEAVGELRLAQELADLREAVNVLKHGAGRALKTLLVRSHTLPATIQAFHGELVEEGDCTPPHDLVLATSELLEHCCDVLEKAAAVIGAQSVPVIHAP